MNSMPPHTSGRFCRRWSVAWSVLALVLLAGACWAKGTDGETAPIAGCEVLASYPHDRQAFTQGLVYHRGRLFESTGIRGKSSIRKVELETGEVLTLRRLPNRYFGEGVTVFAERLVQLTWQDGMGLVYDADTLAYQGSFRYRTEGWGLTHDGGRLIMSDGSAMLYFLDADSYQLMGQVEVRDGGRPIHNLNELEYIDGEVWANVWESENIARIDPHTGRVKSWIDLSGLSRHHDGDLNGIAYDRDTGRIFITGKLWTRIYQIQVVEDP